MRINSILKMGIGYLPDKFLFYSTSFLFGVLGALMVLIIMNLFTAHLSSIGIINVTGLVDQFIKQEEKKNISSDVLQQEVKAFGMKLEKELKTLARQNYLVLLPSEAVVAGGHDYTMFIKQKMNEMT